ncbi:TRAP transporter small permease [Lentibacillus juripiscarius]|uniref:TRAP transporter small permease n=1 Tax=Lentibacillus juripiscarius TaxID=257446 RepID=A0ABW5V1Q7_9BACI
MGKKIDKVWSEIEKGILSITTLLMTFMLVGNAVSRYFFSKSWGFSEEAGRLAIVVMTFVGISYAARKGMHIEMSGFYDMMPERYQRVLTIIINIVTTIVMLISTYLSFQYVVHLYQIGEVSSILRIPLYLVMSFIPLGFFLAAVRYFIDFINVTFKRV